MAWDSRHSGLPSSRSIFCQLERSNLNNICSLGGTLSNQKRSARLILKISALHSVLGYLRHLLMIKCICAPIREMVSENSRTRGIAMAGRAVVSNTLIIFSIDCGNYLTASLVFINPAKSH